MEDQRLRASGFFDDTAPSRADDDFASIAYEGERSSSLRRPTLIPVAVLSVCLLGSVTLWSIFGSHQAQSPAIKSVTASAMESADADPTAALVSTLQGQKNDAPQVDVSAIGPAVVGTLNAQYQALKSQGLYTPAAGDQIGAQLASAVNVPVPYRHYSTADVHLSSNTSYSGMLAYRAALKDALAPLVSIKDSEISIFAGYTATKDKQYLDELRDVAAKYDAAVNASLALSVPSDAASYHVGILNAMAQFGATLRALADNADNPITSVVLLQSYNDGESTMVQSFNALAMYFAHHPKP